jgi:predicted alpha/beta-hydrolase family hydrolase
MLFLQGTRDALAERGRMRRVVERLGSRATVAWFEEADHAFHVPARRGSDDDVIAALAAAIAAFVGQSGR